MSIKWLEKLNGNPAQWLLESNPWTKYRTLVDLMDEPPDSSGVLRIKKELSEHPQVISVAAEASEWFPQSITRHNDSKLSSYKLMMLMEFGLDISDSKIGQISEKANEHLENDMFSVRQVLPESGKGFAKYDPDANEWHALPCDSPIILYSLTLSGLDSPVVRQAVDRLKDEWHTGQGWFCHFFFVEGQYKKLQAGCPMAGLMALEVFSQIPDLKESIYAQNAFEPIKFHREYGKSVYYFGRSKQFWTLKYPFVWYNALYLADVLTRFDFLKGNILIKELIDWIENSQDKDGRFKPTSMWMPYKGWDFANKKEPSPWITLLCCRILKRWYE
ncbi:hypothetical protein ACFLYQ_05155 [Chloroflexota bacterium]